jgi:hypothetical protein
MKIGGAACGGESMSLGNSLNVEDTAFCMVVPHTRGYLSEIRVLVADHNRLGVIEDAVNAIHQVMVDFVRIANRRSEDGKYDGICW